MIRKSVLLVVLAALPVLAQTTTRRGIVTAYGEGTVSVKPDMARVSLGVITTATSATDAAAKNADQATALIAALRGILGTTADIRTVTYNVGPTYTYPPGGGQPTLTGFQVTNVIQATVNDTNLIGRLIDAGIQAGANRIDGISFGLKNEDPVRNQALQAAAQKAKQKADNIAAGLGVKTGAIVAVEEGSQITPVANVRAGVSAVAAATTPVEPGTMDVKAIVTLQLEVVQ